MKQAAEQSRDTAGIPRLRYYHGLAWVAVFALLLTIHDWQVRAWNTSLILGEITVEESTWQSIQRYVTNAIAGVSITLVIFGCAWRKLGVPVPSQPGHWLVIFHAIVFLSFTCSQLLSMRLEAAADEIERNDLAGLTLLFALVWASGLASISLCLTYRLRQHRQWRLAYLLVAALMGLMILPIVQWLLPIFPQNGVLFGTVDSITFRQYAPIIVSGSLLAVILHCAAMDLMYEQRRDWAHWIGALTYLAGLGMTLADRVMLL